MPVVVVESPAKAKTINKYLGPDYTVLASYGHVRDLPAKDGSVNPDAGFDMTWEVAADSKKHVRAIAEALATRLARDLLPVYDNLRRALDAASDDTREQAAAPKSRIAPAAALTKGEAATKRQPLICIPGTPKLRGSEQSNENL